MPNKGRGEVLLKLDGREYVLRPSFETLAAIEEASDKSVTDLLLGLGASTKFKDIVLVLWMAAKKSRNADIPLIDKFGELVRRELGNVAAGQVVRDLLIMGCSSDKQIEAAEQEVNETKDPDPSSRE